MRTDPMGKFCHPEKRSVVGQCEGCVGVLRSSGMTPCMEKAKPRQEETLTGSGAQDRSRTCTPLDTRT